MLRKIIPLHLQNKVGEKLRSLTKRKAKKQALDNETKLILENHYLPYANKLDTLLKNLQ